MGLRSGRASLGMTFLARFNVTLTNGALELTPRVLN
ncbi:hypothetical protein V1293_001739 [Bradyrhizobium sp. AZCC 1693]